MTNQDSPPSSVAEDTMDDSISLQKRVLEWITRPPYKKRELQAELAHTKAYLRYSENLPRHYQCRRNNLDILLELSRLYLKRAESALRHSSYLEFHKNINHSDRVIFLYLLSYEKITRSTPNWLEFRKLAIEYAVSQDTIDIDEEREEIVEKLQSEEDLTIKEWIWLYQRDHDQKIGKHEKERIKQAKSNKKIRQLSITTFLTLGTSLLILWTLSSSDTGSAESTTPFVRNSQLFVSAALFGLLGALVSDLSKYSHKRNSSPPDEYRSAIHGIWATAAKYTFGATSAVILAIILYSGFLPAINTDELTFGLIIVIAFCAGFSERLVKRAMEAVSF